MKDFTFSIESKINCDKQRLWNHIVQMKNVNYELMPFARMTYPSNLPELNANEIPLRTTLFKSFILLFGFIPIDWHFLKLDEIKEGEYFRENSTTLMHRYWKHHRSMREENGNVFVRDEISFLPRIPFLGNALLPVYKMVFKNRHKRLRDFFI